MTKLLPFVLGVVMVSAIALVEATPQVDEIRITFLHPPEAPPPFGGGLPKDASYPAGAGSRETGPFSRVAVRNISGIRVTWFDIKRFSEDAQVEGLLRELLTSENSETFGFHVWSNLDGVPAVLATVQHRAGAQGRWVIWCRPGLTWAYQDAAGKWLWGYWEGYKAPLPKACAAVAK